MLEAIAARSPVQVIDQAANSVNSAREPKRKIVQLVLVKSIQFNELIEAATTEEQVKV